MREFDLLRKIYLTYKALGLNRVKLLAALLFMLLTSFLEMAGLSALYPLVLSLTGDASSHALPVQLPFQISLDPAKYTSTLLMGVAVIFVVKNVSVYFTYEHNINFAIYFYRNLIRGLYGAHIQKPLLDFQKESAGSLSNMICAQTQKLVDGSIRPMMVVISEFFILVAITALVFILNPMLMTLVILTCGGAGALYYWLLRDRVLSWGQKEMEAAAGLQEIVSNSSRGISEIKVFNKEAYLTGKLYELAVTKTRMFHHQEMHQQGPRYIAETTFMVTLVAFFLVILRQGANPAVLLAQFSVMAAASFRLLPSINRIVHSYSNFSFNVGPSTVLLNTILQSHILDQQKTQAGAQDKNPLASQLIANKGFKTVSVDNVSFSYPTSSKKILQEVNLKFALGEKVGLIGESGSGKSTLIKIIAGLFPPTSGRVRVDNTDIAHDLKGWQSHIGYVPQEAFIMPGTLAENIAFGEEVDDVQRIWSALEIVGLKNWAESLEYGLEQKVGDKGITLSGGQKQLLCLARALYRRPHVLLLDEPTASLDEQNERSVLNAIDRLPADCLVIMASHKHMNFRAFDVVYAFDFSTLSFKMDSERLRQVKNEVSRL